MFSALTGLKKDLQKQDTDLTLNYLLFFLYCETEVYGMDCNAAT
jgi:hypothetical protein